MNVLEVIQQVAPVVGIAIPDAVFGSTGRTEQELAALANEMALRIAGQHDWQRLRRLHTLTGDGTSENYEMPADFDRFSGGKATLRTDQWADPLEHITDQDLWLDWKIRGFAPSCFNAWSMIGGRLEFLPTLAADRVVKFYYQSDKIVRTSGTTVGSSFPYTLAFELADSGEFGSARDSFTADEDFFQLDWNLLKLGMIWQWKANKGLPYAEDMANFEKWLAKRITEDGGARAVCMGRVNRRGSPNTWPTTVPSS